MYPLLFLLLLVLLGGFIVMALTLGDGVSRCAADIMGIAGCLAVVIAVAAVERCTDHTGEKP